MATLVLVIQETNNNKNPTVHQGALFCVRKMTNNWCITSGKTPNNWIILYVVAWDDKTDGHKDTTILWFQHLFFVARQLKNLCRFVFVLVFRTEHKFASNWHKIFVSLGFFAFRNAPILSNKMYPVASTTSISNSTGRLHLQSPKPQHKSPPTNWPISMSRKHPFVPWWHQHLVPNKFYLWGHYSSSNGSIILLPTSNTAAWCLVWIIHCAKERQCNHHQEQRQQLVLLVG